jgi:hypothetical protein
MMVYASHELNFTDHKSLTIAFSYCPHLTSIAYNWPWWGIIRAYLGMVLCQCWCKNHIYDTNGYKITTENKCCCQSVKYICQLSFWNDLYFHAVQIAVMPEAKKDYSENDMRAAVRWILEVRWTVYKASNKHRYLTVHLKKGFWCHLPLRKWQFCKGECH